MKTTPFLAEKDVETDPNIMDNIGEKDEGLAPGAHRRARVLEKSPFRYSLASQYSSTSASGSSHSQRFSIASTDSNNGQERIDNTFIPHRRSGDSGSFEHVPQPSSPTGTSFSSLPPSSRYLLSGATSSETFREQELSRFYPTNKLRHIKALSDPYVSMPCIALSTLPVETHSNFSHERLSPEPFDPWCMSVKVALDNAICSGWLHKHDPPSFAFQRSWKRRFVVLVDRIVYIFKSDKATNPAREHFLLTDDTLVFVSEEFKRGFVLELRKPLCKWFLRCESAAEMKFWLEAMKKIVACSKLGHRGAITASILATLKLTDDFRLLTVASPTPQQSTSLTSNKRPPSTVNINSQRISSRAEHRSAILRASLPPPASRTEQPGKNKLSWMDYSDGNINRRGSMPLGSPRQSTKTVIDKRRSLAQIPGWEHALPPQMPPPRSCPPSVPVADDAPRSSLETVRED